MNNTLNTNEKEQEVLDNFNRVVRRKSTKAFLLVAPLFIAVIIFFVLPIGGMLSNSFIDDNVSISLPNTVVALQGWDEDDLPQDSAYVALLKDLENINEDGNSAALAQRLNAEITGFRNVLFKTMLRLPGALAKQDLSATEKLIDIDLAWGNIVYWKAIKHASSYITPTYLLSALDLHYDVANDKVIKVNEHQAVFQAVFARTLYVSGIITFLCLLLGYPLAYWLANMSESKSNILMIFVLLPFWTSLIVRTAAWIVLLQTDGVISQMLQFIHLATPSTQLSFNRFGVIVAMTHVLLPFMVLPLYSVMKGIPDIYTKAAISLGAHPIIAFIRVYMPQTMAGVGSGVLLTFILAIGYYVTPILIGGAADQMISYFIAFYTSETVNWGLASALGSILLLTTLVLYFVYNKLAMRTNVDLM